MPLVRVLISVLVLALDLQPQTPLMVSLLSLPKGEPRTTSMQLFLSATLPERQSRYPFTAPAIIVPLILRYITSPSSMGGRAPTIITAAATPH